MAKYQLNIISPRGRIFAGEADSLVAPGVEGDLGVLAGHAPMIALIRRGVGKVETGSETHHYVFGEGILEVTKEEVVLLTDTAERAPSHEAARQSLQDHLAAAAAKSTAAH